MNSRLSYYTCPRHLSPFKFIYLKYETNPHIKIVVAIKIILDLHLRIGFPPIIVIGSCDGLELVLHCDQLY